MENMIAVCIFIFGSMIGSFLNVCIVRLPHQKSIVFPGSHCVKCQKSIPWYDNIPLLSYWILGGKCRFCGAKFSSRYFCVELLTAIMFVVFYRQFGLNAVLWPYLIFLSGLLVATFVDLEHRIIPDEISIGGMFVGFLCSGIVPALHASSIPSLMWGRTLMRLVVGLCSLAILWGFFVKKDKFDREDSCFFIFVGVVLVIDLMVEIFIPNPSLQGPGLQPFVVGLDASIVGAMVGGGVIYAMGLLGDLLFRGIVPRKSLKEISNDSNELFKDLVAKKYLSKRGYITSGFVDMKDFTEMILDPRFENDKEKIFLFVRDHLGTMGGGDVKLMALVGAFLGWPLAVLSFFIAPFFGAIYGGIEKLRTGDSHIAYGPFLSIGALVCLFWGEKLIDWVISGPFYHL